MAVQDELSPGSERRKHPRTPLSILVQYRFDSLDEFVAEYSLNLSPGGIFIRTEMPRDEETMVYLQFSLKDGSKLIEGLGRVVRATWPPGDPRHPAGMGIEFVNFDEESMSLIYDICAAREAKARGVN